MTPPGFVLYLMCLLLEDIGQATTMALSSFHHEEGRFVSTNVGESLILQCFYEPKDITVFYWYKQTLGQKPRLVSSLYVFRKIATLMNEFNNSRFAVDTEIGNNHLHITDLQISDSGTYYCGRRAALIIEFAEGITVNVKGSGSNIKALVHQSASESIQPGDSVTLNCTVHTGTCDGEHSVYWFRNQEDEESPPGLIYTHGGRNDQCERKPDTQTHTCVYNLPMKSLNLSHAGTYYCAVVSCGRILFGNGTKVDFQDNPDYLVLVYFLSGALAFTTTLSVFSLLLVYKKNQRNRCQTAEAQARISVTLEGNEDNLHYAALRELRTKGLRRQRNNMEGECVYSSVKH